MEESCLEKPGSFFDIFDMARSKASNPGATKRFLELVDRLKEKGVLSSDMQLAGRLGCTPSLISGYRKGRSDVSLAILTKFEKEFGIDAGYVLTGVDMKVDQLQFLGKFKGKVLHELLEEIEKKVNEIGERHEKLIDIKFEKYISELLGIGELKEYVTKHQVKEAFGISEKEWQAYKRKGLFEIRQVGPTQFVRERDFLDAMKVAGNGPRKKKKAANKKRGNEKGGDSYPFL
jgi:transcriptional regulator with XRE-family HTH domain